jgi:nucleoside-diphosphate-sugar epimerase
VQAVFHLASLVSGGAEQSFELGTRVNLDATRDLLEACRLAGHRPKFIFASLSAVMREPLAGRDYVCPVAPETRLACISLRKVVQSFLHALVLPSERIGTRRTMLLNGISASAQEMWDAVKFKAAGNVRFSPDPTVQSVMDGAPKSTFSKRSAELGFPASASIQEIVREYEEAALAHHG